MHTTIEDVLAAFQRLPQESDELSAAEAGDLLGVSDKTAAAWVDAGLLEALPRDGERGYVYRITGASVIRQFHFLYGPKVRRNDGKQQCSSK